MEEDLVDNVASIEVHRRMQQLERDEAHSSAKPDCESKI